MDRSLIPVWLLGAMVACGLGGCATAPPRATENICSIFKEKSGWYKAARSSEAKWHSPIAVMMSFVYQESLFESKAKPPRSTILWVIPGPRPSSAYGYSQAKNEAWDEFRRATGQRGADRNDFDDAIDFIGWYNTQSHKRNGIASKDAYSLYLAYHEGQGGFGKRSYKNKQWLVETAKAVAARAVRYDRQLAGCRKELDSRWWWPF